MESVVIVLLVVAVASAYPYSPYTDPKGESSNVKLSEEAVAAYLKNKMEDEKLEPAKIMNYVESLLQGGGKGGNTQKDPECLTTGGALTHSKLDTILDTVYPINTNLIPHETILTPDHGKTLYYNEVDNPLDAYRRMIEETTGEITTIWANYSPCPSCVRKLLDVFKEGDKPTIYFARVYKETEKLSDIVTSLQCLGKLQHKGFSVVAWNFDTFKGDSVLTSECTSAITSAYTKENFTSALMELGRHATFIQQLGDNTHASSWCEA